MIDLLDEFLLSTANEIFIPSNMNKAVLQSDDFDMIKVQSWTNRQQSISEAKTQAMKNQLTQLDIDSYLKSKGYTNYGIVKADKSIDYTTLFYPNIEAPQTTTKFIAIDLSNTAKTIIDISEATFQYSNSLNSLQNNLFDTALYNDYMSKGIDILNPNDEVFTNPCYFNWNLEYDLPQEYRYNSLYQGKTIVSANGECIYKGYDITSLSIILECASVNSDGGLTITMVEKPIPVTIDKNHVDNLPTKCGGQIAEIANNFGFWTYLFVFIIGLILTILIGVVYLLSMSKNYIQGWIISDDMTSSYSQTAVKSYPNATVPTEANVNNDNQIHPSNVNVIYGKSFIQQLLYNFKTIHPITNVCRGSIVTPLMLKIAILMYNIFNLFGFNALYYNETMIGKKMEDKNRDNFGNPMKNEFHKIVYALLTSMALTMIVRAITLVTMGKRDKLAQKLENAQSIDEKHSRYRYRYISGQWC